MAWQPGPDLGVQGSSTIIDAGNRALQRFRDRRIPIPANSRLERALTTLERAQRDSSSSRNDLLAEAIRTVYEMRLISRALGDSNDCLSRRLTNTLACMLGGPDMVSEETDAKSSKPRNFQFEMIIAAILTAGAVPVRPEEPDLLMQYIGDWYGVAAKRVKIRKNIRRRVKEAANQIKKRKMPGFVALNMDCLLDEFAAECESFEEVTAEIDRLPDLINVLGELGERPEVRGLLALGTYVAWEPTSSAERRLGMSTYWKWHFLNHSDEEIVRSEQFQVEFRSAFQRNLSF